MEIDEVRRIKKLIQRAEVNSAKAQGVLDNLEKKWKAQFGDGSISTAKRALADLEEKNKKQEKRRDELMEQLERLYDWDALADNADEEDDE